MDHFFTHHNVDQFPQLDELSPQDQAMDCFRAIFPVPIVNAHVCEDGLSMRYKMKDVDRAARYLQVARLVILARRLPLEVKHDLFKVQGVIFENALVVTYVPQTR